MVETGALFLLSQGPHHLVQRETRKSLLTEPTVIGVGSVYEGVSVEVGPAQEREE